ncbi:MAG: non-hydrolyzing UDP-N-acetylglucosamine 2-epimerase [Betaproteobacteria bacterium]
MNAHGPILCVVGARPNLMKVAPVLRAFAAHAPPIAAFLVHTGQHYDEAMDGQVFRDLGLPPPDAHLGVGSGSHAVQTAEIMKRFEPVLDATRPRAVLVVGDVNSSLACALVAAKRGVPVIHVEAGLRSGDWSMPEEINRVLTDRLSEVLFATEASALANLRAEGIDMNRAHLVGNVMIDSLSRHRPRAGEGRAVLARIGAADLAQGQARYGMLTLHRPSNVDDPAVLTGLVGTLAAVAARVPLVFPAHPRTRAMLRSGALEETLERSGVRLLSPVGYVDMLALMNDAALVLTDSGGIQEETTALGVACGTLRENTERPATVAEGTNTLLGRDPGRILAFVEETIEGRGKRGRSPELWDGRAAERIAALLGGGVLQRP